MTWTRSEGENCANNRQKSGNYSQIRSELQAAKPRITIIVAILAKSFCRARGVAASSQSQFSHQDLLEDTMEGVKGMGQFKVVGGPPSNVEGAFEWDK